MSSTTEQPVKQERPKKVAHRSHPAGFFSRLEAFVIDLLILSIVPLVASAFIQMFLRFFRFTGLSAALDNFFNNTTMGSVLLTLFVIAYFTFFWSLVGFTPGKAVLGLKVVRKNGGKASFGRSLLRFFAYWISAVPLFLGFLWVLWDPNRQGWHDKIAGTKVLYTPRKPNKQAH
jgi:uncharacterized RDD family membrane protein YckC